MPGLNAVIPNFGLALPEIVLALGALALVLLGALRGDRSLGLITNLSLGLLVFVGYLVLCRSRVRTQESGVGS